jgi:hypothetical protein
MFAPQEMACGLVDQLLEIKLLSRGYGLENTAGNVMLERTGTFDLTRASQTRIRIFKTGEVA